MAVQSVKETFFLRSSSEDETARVATRHFIVETEDKIDDPISVRTAEGIPRIRDAHPTDPTMWARSIDVSPRGENATVWDVAVEYASSGYGGFGAGDTDGDGVPDDPNPLLRPTLISYGFIQQQVPVAEGMYYGKYKLLNNGTYDNSELKNIGDAGVFRRDVMSSARERFDPLPVEDVAFPVITIVKNEAAFDLAKQRQRINKVNADDFLGAVKGTLKMADISAESRAESVTQANGATVLIRYFQVTYQIHHKEEGWWQDILDQGTVSSEFDQSANRYVHRVITDEDGLPRQTPTKLNGSGQILEQKDTPNWPQAVFHSYLFLETANFGAWGLV